MHWCITTQTVFAEQVSKVKYELQYMSFSVFFYIVLSVGWQYDETP